MFQVRIKKDCIMHKVYVPSLTGLISWYRIFSEVTLVAKIKMKKCTLAIVVLSICVDLVTPFEGQFNEYDNNQKWFSSKNANYR